MGQNARPVWDVWQIYPRHRVWLLHPLDLSARRVLFVVIPSNLESPFPPLSSLAWNRSRQNTSPAAAPTGILSNTLPTYTVPIHTPRATPISPRSTLRPRDISSRASFEATAACVASAATSRCTCNDRPTRDHVAAVCTHRMSLSRSLLFGKFVAR